MYSMHICFIGIANAEILLCIIAKNFGWNTSLAALLLACAMAVLLNLESYEI